MFPYIYLCINNLLFIRYWSGYLSQLQQKMPRTRHRYCFSTCDSIDNVKVFVVRSVYLLPYSICSPYLVHTLIHVGQVCVNSPWPRVHELLNLWNWCQYLVISSDSPLPYNLGLPYLIHKLIIEGTCQPGMSYLTQTSFQWSSDMFA